jgi:hypothetical protein
MAWRVRGVAREHCTCKMWCPCWLGPAEPDQGWCSGSLIFEVHEGAADDIGLDGLRVVAVVDFPADFFTGNGTARLFIDENANAEQRRELEAIFSGRKGGPLEAAWGATVTQWLPTQVANIEIQDGDAPSITVGNVAQVTYQSPIRDAEGRATVIEGAAAATAFGLEGVSLARSDGSRWSAPEMRQWESGGSGTIGAFDWNA